MVAHAARLNLSFFKLLLLSPLHVEFFQGAIGNPVLSGSQSSKAHRSHKKYTLSRNLTHLLRYPPVGVRETHGSECQAVSIVP